jgi:hypothetical protein
MFTKIVGHGLRKARGKPGTLALAALHGIAVVAALVAVTASLIATYKPSKANGLDVVAWWGVGVAAGALIMDIGIEEFSDHRVRKRSHWVGAEGGEPSGAAVGQAPSTEQRTESLASVIRYGNRHDDESPPTHTRRGRYV